MDEKIKSRMDVIREVKAAQWKDQLTAWERAVDRIAAGEPAARVLSDLNVNPRTFYAFFNRHKETYNTKTLEDCYLSVPEEERDEWMRHLRPMKLLSGYENLYAAVTGEQVIENIPLDVDQTMKEVMKEKLNAREKKVIYMRYFHGMTLEEIGDRIGTRRERVRQLEARSLRKMRSCCDYIRFGRRFYIERKEIDRMKREKARLDDLLEEKRAVAESVQAVRSLIKQVNEELGEYAKEGHLVPNTVEEISLNTRLDELPLSVRSYNGLHRGMLQRGIPFGGDGEFTLRDILTLSESELREFRNLGQKSIEEIKEMIQKAGFSLQK